METVNLPAQYFECLKRTIVGYFPLFEKSTLGRKEFVSRCKQDCQVTNSAQLKAKGAYHADTRPHTFIQKGGVMKGISHLEPRTVALLLGASIVLGIAVHEAFFVVAFGVATMGAAEAVVEHWKTAQAHR